jgi:parallel beta-helix repeat protein
MAYSSTNHIINCNIHNSSSNETNNPFYYTGIKCLSSNYNTIEYTTITKFIYGIDFSKTKYNTISHCSISHCEKGISFSISSYEEISQNNISYNNQGIDATYDPLNMNIKGNVITHNTEGILFGNIAGIGHSIITMNTFLSNDIGLTIALCFFVTVKCNNFINNKKDAYFIYSVTRWWRNYWGQPRIFPHIIVGRTLKYLILDAIIILLWLTHPSNEFPELVPPKDIIWFNIDWRPALKPYDIPGMS